ncbi:hypothetical protein [Variovorax sp. UC74_104]|uniref:hypothetical protein n=1 Tax=Variovorax sp. UC74_104 TaxID=3374555 RepID=UPI0037583AB5
MRVLARLGLADEAGSLGDLLSPTLLHNFALLVLRERCGLGRSADGDLATLNGVDQFFVAFMKHLRGRSDASRADIEHLRGIRLADLRAIRQICRML